MVRCANKRCVGSCACWYSELHCEIHKSGEINSNLSVSVSVNAIINAKTMSTVFSYQVSCRQCCTSSIDTGDGLTKNKGAIADDLAYQKVKLSWQKQALSCRTCYKQINLVIALRQCLGHYDWQVTNSLKPMPPAFKFLSHTNTTNKMNKETAMIKGPPADSSITLTS